MLDIKFIRENAEIIKAGAVKKHITVDIDRLIAVDDERKLLKQELDAILQCSPSALAACKRLIAEVPRLERAAAIARPRCTIVTRSHNRSTSPSRWELRITVVPRAPASRMMPRTSSRPRALTGTS
jgi:hypothetical protein